MPLNNMNKTMKSALDGGTYEMVKRIGAYADRQGVKACVVGGMVRDILLKRKTVDIDVVIQGDGMKFAKYLADELHGAYKAFEKFKTAKIFLKNSHLDISSARSETYEKPAALPSVSLSGMDEDLFRRDFTINSMAISINQKDFGVLFDPYGGVRDLKNKVLRTMHDKSFIDDPTRILRAIRFETRLGFKIEKRTFKFIGDTLKTNVFDNLSGERLREELFILFGEQSPLKAVKRLNSLGVLKKINPGIIINAGSIFMLKQIDALRGMIREYSPNTPVLYLIAVLCSLKPKEAGYVAVKLKLSNEQKLVINQAKKLQQLSEKGLSRYGKGTSGTFFLLEKYETDALIYLMLLQKDKKQAQRVRYFLDELRYTKLEISGKDLKELGIKEGPQYSKILASVLKAKLDGKVKTREEQLELVMNLYKM